MKALVDGFELGVGEVGVDLGSGNIGVAEQALNAAEVGAVGEKVGGKGVTQGVGCDVLGETGGAGVAFDESLDAAGCKTLVHAVFCLILTAGVVDKEWFSGVFAGGEVAFDPAGGLGGDEDGAIFLAFAANGELGAVGVDLVAVDGDKLGDAQAAREEQLDDGSVAQANGG